MPVKPNKTERNKRRQRQQNPQKKGPKTVKKQRSNPKETTFFFSFTIVENHRRRQHPMARVKFTPRSGSGAPIKRLREDQSVGAQNEGENRTSTRRHTRSTTAINDEISNNVRCFIEFFFMIIQLI